MTPSLSCWFVVLVAPAIYAARCFHLSLTTSCHTPARASLLLPRDISHSFSPRGSLQFPSVKRSTDRDFPSKLLSPSFCATRQAYTTTAPVQHDRRQLKTAQISVTDIVKCMHIYLRLFFQSF